MAKVSILIPTYNERDNVVPLLQQILDTLAQEEIQVVIIDDNSPDGTGDIIQSNFGQDNRVQLIRRQEKMGLGSALIDGLRVSSGKYIVTMDADLSHRPDDLLKLLEASGDADVVIGSRYIQGSHIKGWPLVRKIASIVAVRLSHVLVNIPVKDTTSGFVLYHREVLEDIASQLDPKGFKFLLEVLAKSSNVRVKEVPITFHNRSAGTSKFNVQEVIVFIRLCLQLRQHQSRKSVQ